MNLLQLVSVRCGEITKVQFVGMQSGCVSASS